MRCDGMSSSFLSPQFLLQQTTDQLLQPPQFLSPLLLPTPSGHLTAFMDQKERESLRRRSTEMGHGEEEAEEEFSIGGEKKRRLNVDQVRTLERNFEMGNRLEPERKEQLAKALGLQPRQIAIWFQNRRARWKTKQLEKDYEALKRQVDSIREENRCLESHNQKLAAQIMAMKGGNGAAINLNNETETSSSDGSAVKLAGGENESFCDVFCGVDDQSGFWPWSEHPGFS